MPAFIRHPKDFWIGIIFIFFGLCAVLIGQDYGMGTAGRMGPAYFPVVLGGLLALIGAIGVIRSFIRQGEAIGRIHVKELVLVLIMVSAFASPKFHLGKTIALAIGLALFAVVLFVKLLGLPMPILGSWFGA